MKINIQSIDIDKIYSNPQNIGRSMDATEIDLLADAIVQNGLLQPPLVCKTTGEGEKEVYLVLAGHRRIEAIRRINDRIASGLKLPRTSPLSPGPVNEVPCIVRDEVPTGWKTQELMMQSNIFRKQPEDMMTEVSLASRNWESMDSPDRKKIRDFIKNCFQRRHRNDKKYNTDPEGYTKENLREKYEYIRMQTGLDIENYIVKKTFVEVLKDADQLPPKIGKAAVESGTKKATRKKKKKTDESGDTDVTLRDIGKAILNPLGILEAANFPEGSIEAAMVANLQASFDEVLEKAGMLSRKI